MNKRIQAVEAKRAAASAERYHRLQSLQAHVDSLFFVEVDKEESMKTFARHSLCNQRHRDNDPQDRQASEWSAAVRNQMGIPYGEPIPMEKMCAEIRTARNITISIGDIDHATRLRLFAAIATVLTPPPR